MSCIQFARIFVTLGLLFTACVGGCGGGGSSAGGAPTESPTAPATTTPTVTVEPTATATAISTSTPLADQMVLDSSLVVERVVDGLVLPTTMSFLAANDILVLEKETGRVRRVLDGNLVAAPVLDVAVNGAGLGGMLGIAVNSEDPPAVFLFYGESEDANGDGSDRGPVLGHRIYRYRWNPDQGTLEDPELLFDFPPSPIGSVSHKGGIVLLGPPAPNDPDRVGDGAVLYAVMGDNGTQDDPEIRIDRQLNNSPDGLPPDDMSVIVRLLQDGSPAPGNPFTPYCGATTSATCGSDLDCPDGETCVTEVASYFGYGIRNSYGLALDPVTGSLWETENGPFTRDEINLADPGFNNGWHILHGPDELDPQGPDQLFDIPGAGSTYSDPEFTWMQPIGVTAIVFPYGSALGARYDDLALVGDSQTGKLFAFPLDPARRAFDFSDFPALQDLVADDESETDLLTWATGFGIVTDLEVGEDGSLYVVSFTEGAIFRILPRG